MLLSKKKETPVISKRLLNELSYNTMKAMGDLNTTQFIKVMRMTDPTPVLNILKKKIVELPDRNLLRRIADNSNGEVSYKLLYNLCGYSESDPEEDRSWMNFVPKRGEIYNVDLGKFGIDSEQQGKRPFLVVSNNKGNTYGGIVVGLPITKIKKGIGMKKIHVPIGREFNMEHDSFALCENICSISKRRFFHNGGIPYKITTLPDFKMKEIQISLEFELGFEELFFDEDKIFKLIEHIRFLQAMNNKKSSTFIEIINQKMNELIEYCGKHGKNLKMVMQEYERVNGYVSQVV